MIISRLSSTSRGVLAWLTLMTAGWAQQPQAHLGGAEVTATLDVDKKFTAGLSLLWSPCGQAAWDQMRRYHKLDSIELQPHSQTAGVLNRFIWDQTATLPDGTLIFGGDDSAQRRDEIREALRKHGGAAAGALVDANVPPGDGAARSALFISYLSHNPRFPAAFEPALQPFTFSTGRRLAVRGFGCQGGAAANHADVVEVLADDLKGSFVLKLTLFNGEKGRPEFMLVATRPGLKSLAAAIAWQKEVMKKPPPENQAVRHGNAWWRWHHRLTAADKFWMPQLSAGVSCDYGDLIGRRYEAGREGGVPGTWQIREARQMLSFRVNERGALAQAVFKIAPDFLVHDASGDLPPPDARKLPLLPRRFMLDGPFVLCLWMKGSDWPYLACWADSEAIMTKP